jgi:hypothetical protein
MFPKLVFLSFAAFLAALPQVNSFLPEPQAQAAAGRADAE